MAPGASVVMPAARERQMSRKVRTGCLTCRQRRIKCDERKPVCQRCENVRRDCKGFGYGSSTVSQPFAASTSLERYRNPMSWSPSERLPCDKSEFRYFQLFRAYSVADLAGCFQSEFWGRSLLQQSHYYSSIKDAIIAIGALYKSIEIAQNSRTGFDARSDFLEHLKSALQHYQRAICSQREAVEIGIAPLRTSLILCLLFICFEALQGNQGSVIQQIICGVHLLQEHESSPTNGRSSLVSQSDEELYQIFARLDVQLRTMEDGRPMRYDPPRIALNLQFSSTRSSTLEIQTDKQPSSAIESLEEARRSWDILFTKLFHVRQLAEPYRYSLPEDVPLDVSMAVAKQLDDLLSWRATFDYLFQKAWNDISEKNRLGASAIKINYHLAYIKISSSFKLQEIIYDSFHFDFQEIVRLSKYLIQAKPPSLFRKTTFSLDSVVGVPLFVTGMKCRDRLLRREASALLRHPERREGMWDSGMASSIVNWLISIEEAGLELDQVIPECNRFRMLDVKCDLQNRRGWVRCGQRMSGNEDYVNVIEFNFTY